MRTVPAHSSVDVIRSMVDSVPGTYADFVLAALPVSVVTGVLVGFVTGIPLRLSLGAGAGVAVVLMLDALFR